MANPFLDLIPSRDNNRQYGRSYTGQPDPRRGLETQRLGQQVAESDEDRRRREAAERRAAQSASRLPDAVTRDLTQDIDAFAGLARAANGFQDDFSGPGLPLFDSSWENTFQERLGTGTPGQRQWWADFSAADNAARNRLFGASLSEGEQAAYARTTVSPNMRPEEVRANLGERMEQARGALARRVNALRAQGYSNEAIDAMLGEYRDFLNPQPQAQQGQQRPAPAIGSPPSGQPYNGQMTRADRAIGRTMENVQVEGGAETQEYTPPALEGLNNRINQMLQQRRPLGEILQYVRERGVDVMSPGAQGEAPLHAQLRALRRWQQQNPNYRGPFNVNVERYMRPTTSAEQFMSNAADSPVGAFAMAAGDVATGGHLDNLASLGTPGLDAELANLGMQQVRERHPYASVAGDISGGASLYGLGRAATSKLASQFPRTFAAMGGPAGGQVGALAPRAIAGDATMGAYIGSGQGGTDIINPEGALRGAAFGAGGGVAGRGTINALGSAVSPTGGSMAALYAQGVQPTIGQRIGGAVNRVEQAFESVPFVGGIQRGARNQAREQFQVGAFNQALEDIGLQLPRAAGAGRRGGATRAHLFAQRAFDREFRDVRRQATFTPDQEFGQRFGAILQDLETLPQDSQNVFRSLIEKDLASRLRAGNNQLSGDSYLRVASRIDRTARNIRKNPNGDHQLAELLEGMSEAIDEAAARQTPGLAPRLTSVRRGYRKLVIIEDAARRRGTGSGEFSPSQFDAGVQNIGGGLRSRAYLRGQAPMQEYAEAGLRLGDDLANSGTADRFMGTGAPFVLGGLGYVNPALLTPWAASTLATAPGFRQILNAALSPNRPGLAGFRSQIQDRAYLGGMAGLPLIPQQ